MVPITIGICAQVQHKFEVLEKLKSVPSELAPIVEIIAADIALAIYLTERVTRHIIKERKQYPTQSRLVSFLTPYPCICLTGILSAIFAILIIIYGSVFNFVPTTEARLANLIVTYNLISGLCAAAILINFFYTKMSDQNEQPLRAVLHPQKLDKEVRKPYEPRIPKFIQIFVGLTRPFPCLIAGLLTMMVAEKAGTFFAVRAGIAMTLVVMFGFAVDNIYDRNADQIAGIKTPLTLRLISIQGALGIAILLGFSALIISPSLNASLLVLLPTLIALAFYPLFSSNFSLLKGIYTAILICIPLFYPSLMIKAEVSIQYYLILFLFIVAREAFIDGCQAHSDKAVGRKTCAVKWNTEMVKRWSGYSMLVTAMVLAGIVRGPLPRAFAALSALTVALILYSPLIKRRHAGWLRVSMIFGAIALALSSSS